MIGLDLDARALGNLRGVINAQAQKRADRIAHEAADIMLEVAQEIIADELINNRPARRRRGGMKIENSLEAVVEGEGTPHVRAVLRTRSGARHSTVKLLNSGSDPHFIEAVQSEDGFLWMPQPGSGPVNQAYGKANKKFRIVFHPGTVGLFFMEQAQREAKLRLQR